MAEKKTNREKLNEITASIERGIKELFESDRYVDYLKTMSRFHSYSARNTILIHMQRPDATAVAGFNAWKNKFQRHVKKGEKGITILAPTPFKKKIEEMKRDPLTNAPILDRDGNAIMEEKEVEIPMFRPVKVFDVSQTEGKPLPQLGSILTGDVQNYEIFMEALHRTSPVPIEIGPINGEMDGFFRPSTQSITIREGMSEVQTISVTIHEITHSLLHNQEQDRASAAAGTEKEFKPKDRNTQEVEAESVAYSVCQYYGIQTGEDSFAYIANWSKNRELPELKASLDTIGKTAHLLISDIDRHFKEICQERGIDLTVQEQEQTLPEAEVQPEPKQAAEQINNIEVPDTLEQFSADLCDYMDRLRQSGTLELPNALKSREQSIADLVAEMQNGYFDGPLNTLMYIAEHSDDAKVDALLGRLDKLEEQAKCPTADEALFVVDDAAFLHIQVSDDCFDYTIYDMMTMRQLDGGQISMPDMDSSSPPDFKGVASLIVQADQNLSGTSLELAPLGMVNVLREAADRAVQEAAAEIEEQYPDPLEKLRDHISAVDDALWDTTLDEYPMPDPAFLPDELEQNYGYMDGDLLPLSKDRAAELLDRDLTIYAIVDGGAAEMVFDQEDLEERPIDAVFGVPKDEWEASEDFRQAVADRMNHQEEREKAFLDHGGDCFALYQLRFEGETMRLLYEPLNIIQIRGLSVDRNNYDLAYTAPLSEGVTLDTLWEKFNTDHPVDYQRPSMSISDIVAIKQDGMLSFHYCDRFGFTEIADFIPPENYLKNAEMAMEDDLGMIDGIINNGPKEGPSVAELEAQVKAGQTISLTDLAAASHREEEAEKKKKSVREKLKTPPEQKKKRTAPKKSAERDR
jgi:antirestriction protein ArdC